MKVSKGNYFKIINALDAVRADNRESKYGGETRQIDDDILLFIERKGYCKYIVGDDNKCVRVLTESGYEVLASQDYAKYLKRKALDKWTKRLPIIISIIALLFSGTTSLLNYLTWRKGSQQTETQNRLKRLETLQEQYNLYRHPRQPPNTKSDTSNLPTNL